MISNDYPQRLTGGVGVKEQGTANVSQETVTCMVLVCDVAMGGRGERGIVHNGKTFYGKMSMIRHLTTLYKKEFCLFEEMRRCDGCCGFGIKRVVEGQHMFAEANQEN